MHPLAALLNRDWAGWRAYHHH